MDAIAGSIAKAAASFAGKKVSDYRIAGALAAAYSRAAYETIEAADAEHGNRSAIWLEVAEAIGNPDSAALMLGGGGLDVSSEASALLQSFSTRLVGYLRDLVPMDQRASTESVLAAIFGVRTDIEAMAARIREIDQLVRATNPPDPNADLAWWERPGAPTFELRPGLESKNGTPHVYGTLSVRSEPMVGALKLHIGLDGGARGEAYLMPENSSRPPAAMKYQFKPVLIPIEGAGDEPWIAVTASFTWAGRHAATWRFPMRHHEKGHWISTLIAGPLWAGPSWREVGR